MTIGRKTEAEIESTFNNATTLEVAAGATTAADVSIVLHADDVVVGRTYQLKSVGGSGGASFAVEYTAVAGDTKLQVMEGIRDAMLAADASFLGAASTTVDVRAASGSGTLKIDENLGMGKRFRVASKEARLMMPSERLSSMANFMLS